ncbi:PREDICTED: protein-methionine sulfoxide oxidase MICAL3 isoform X9 [Cyprinodon variegatus]|uniref:protein-methionine sulfoxide oxidase MICAL3 isoform X9 n=1 Tax=Cyprinodon variegatus TaxID=28743 RepID=UPI0007426C4C|nr:PREDICTED: protein-methionine sulfoxide oxidase MICAL3 isoform X9 [Cyprinodon variegatus]
MGDGGTSATGGINRSHVLFDNFVQATTCKGTLKAFQEFCEHLEVKPTEHRIFYHKLKSKLNYWKAKALWAKLDKRAGQKEYKKGRACANTKCLIIGAGPCGLRTAIELAFLGARVVLLEKRDAFSRNNVLHLWPFTIHDLRGLGAKKFYGKFCAGAIDHISIRQLQLMLLKMALLLGIEIHVNVEFKGLIEPPEDQETERIGWRAEVHPKTHPVNELEFDVIIGADGRRNTLPGFRRKEFRGKLAIAITANFINRNTTAEAKVEEISGVAFIFNQKFFQDLREATGIDLENIVYYKDDTHYFVMTAKKQSLLEKGVILHDYADTELLLSRANVDQAALLSYAREAADFSTNHQLPTLDFAINHYGQPDVAMFDFTCMYASENAAMVRQRHGHKLLVALVGDSLLEPFWPMGTGIARGFLAAMDSGWMVKSWAQGKTPLEVLAERESIYRLLPQTTSENVSKNFSQYSVDPTTRYPNISLNFLRPSQVRHLFDTGEGREIRIEIENVINSSTPKLARNESIARSSKLLNWCQRQTEGYRNVSVTDLTMSWKSGLALCALIHRYRPDLIDFDCLDEENHERNNQLAFDVAEKEFGISPCMTGKEMSSVVEPDKLSMVMYLSQFYEMFRDTVPPGDNQNWSPEEKAALIASTKSPISFLSKLGQSIAISRKRNPKDKKEKDVDGLGKRRKTSQSEDEDISRTCHEERPSVPPVQSERKMDSAAAANHNKVKVMATQLLAKFEENAPAQPAGLKRQGSLRKEFPVNIGGSDVCFFCRKRVYVMERLSAEGKFFHRSCFKCDYCGTTLRLSSYAFDVEDGKFYCKPHYCYRLSGYAQRKRPAPSAAPVSTKENQTPQTPTSTVDAPSRGPAAPPSADIQPSALEVNGLQEPSLAKRLRGTPERIELENYRLSIQREEDLEEVPEETLAEHNLSSVLDKATDADLGSSSSSESDMEEEDEQEDQEEAEEQPLSPSDLGGVPWKEAVELHAKLRGDGEELESEALADAVSRDGDGEEDEEEEEDGEEEDEDEEDEEESSDEGDYCPWDRELLSGLWLERHLTDEEDVGKFKVRNIQIQQMLQPVDPNAIPSLVRVRSDSEGDPDGSLGTALRRSQPSELTQASPTAPAHTSTRHEAVRVWLESLSGEPCEDEELEAEADSPDMEPGTELDQEDIPSDAEAEARLHQSEQNDAPPEENKDTESLARDSSIEPSSVSPVMKDDIVLSPLRPLAEPETLVRQLHFKVK